MNMNWVKENIGLIAGGIVLAIIGVWLFDSLWGGLAGALTGLGKLKGQIDEGKGKAAAAEERQEYHEQAGDAKVKKAKDIAKERKEVKHDYAEHDDDEFLDENSSDKSI